MINRDRATKYLLRDYFQLPRTQALMPALIGANLGQADLVLSLLRLRDTCRTPYARIYSCYITLLVGHPIVVGPRCLLAYRTNGHSTVTRDPAARRITYVAPANPRQPGTPAHARWPDFKVGRTLA